jgi:aminoglycoside phosphotransferase family enzyme/predicted kinase
MPGGLDSRQAREPRLRGARPAERRSSAAARTRLRNPRGPRHPGPAGGRRELPPRLRGVFPGARLIETHISWVFLGRRHVHKVKKPVSLGFLDFRTLARRRHFCEEEVRLNRRLAPDTYLGVEEIRRGGRVVEVAVRMRRLPASRMLDRLVVRDLADAALMERVGRRIADFHASAATGRSIAHFGSRRVIERNWRENFAQTRGFPPEVLPPELHRDMRAWVGRILRDASRQFAERVRAGRIRDCHGDLQAQHVCCTEPIRVFDCIEFNHRFRYGDTASEIAFLGMDLDHLGRRDLGVDFLNAYLDASGDYAAVPLLDFYRAYRAWVRGKVLGMQGPARRAEARAYFALAAGYAAPRPAPRLLVMTGVTGSGKTTVARRLAREAGARNEGVVVRTDAVRRQLAGVPWHHRSESGIGAGLYTPEMTTRTYARCLELARDLLAARWTVILDGVFARRPERDAARALARDLDVDVEVVWCDAPEAILRQRLRERARVGQDLSEAREELLDAQRAVYESPDGEPGVVRVSETRRDRPA